MTAATSSALIGLAAIAAFALSFWQARINARHGTDHAVHSFLIRQIRANGFRLFVRIPRLLNEAYIGALPLYLHAIMARLPLSILPVAEKTLNPTANLLLVGLAGMAALVFDYRHFGDSEGEPRQLISVRRQLDAKTAPHGRKVQG